MVTKYKKAKPLPQPGTKAWEKEILKALTVPTFRIRIAPRIPNSPNNQDSIAKANRFLHTH